MESSFNNLVDSDFIVFIRTIIKMGLMDSSILGNHVELMKLAYVLKLDEEKYSNFRSHFGAEIIGKIHDLVREIYNEYLLYGGMVLEKSEEYYTIYCLLRQSL